MGEGPGGQGGLIIPVLLIAGLLLVLILQLVLLMRRPRVELPPEWAARLQVIESNVQAVRDALAKTDGELDGLAQQMTAANAGVQSSIELLRQSLDNRLAGLAAAQAEQLSSLRTDAATNRTEIVAVLDKTRGDTSRQMLELHEANARSREAVAASTLALDQRIHERFAALSDALRGSFEGLRLEVNTQLGTGASATREQLALHGEQLGSRFASLQGSLAQQLSQLSAGMAQNADGLRTALNERLAAIQTDNAAKLEQMRLTVDEKLHATLEQRLGESFKLVSERLEQVHKGLGEMQTLAGSVGDLKRVMTNVKTRGTWGEWQLGALIENVLTPDQFSRNVKVVPGSAEMVEFAVRLPGRGHEQPVWLPIDAKFPVEHYQRLQDALEQADKTSIATAGQAFETSIRNEARRIAAKYVSPPHTTDFALLYLPSEGLYAEVIRRPGLVEALQTEHRIVVAGPANLAAILNSLQMGFKTLAIERRSSEVWGLLSAVKLEFGKFGEAIEATQKSIDAASKRFGEVGVRTRAIQRKLRDVQEIAGTPGAGGALAPAPLDALDLDDDGAAAGASRTP